jgi:hypothetical protein
MFYLAPWSTSVMGVLLTFFNYNYQSASCSARMPFCAGSGNNLSFALRSFHVELSFIFKTFQIMDFVKFERMRGKKRVQRWVHSTAFISSLNICFTWCVFFFFWFLDYCNHPYYVLSYRGMVAILKICCNLDVSSFGWLIMGVDFRFQGSFQLGYMMTYYCW